MLLTTVSHNKRNTPKCSEPIKSWSAFMFSSSCFVVFTFSPLWVRTCSLRLLWKGHTWPIEPSTPTQGLACLCLLIQIHLHCKQPTHDQQNKGITTLIFIKNYHSWGKWISICVLLADRQQGNWESCIRCQSVCEWNTLRCFEFFTVELQVSPCLTARHGWYDITSTMLLFQM